MGIIVPVAMRAIVHGEDGRPLAPAGPSIRRKYVTDEFIVSSFTYDDRPPPGIDYAAGGYPVQQLEDNKTTLRYVRETVYGTLPPKELRAVRYSAQDDFVTMHLNAAPAGEPALDPLWEESVREQMMAEEPPGTLKEPVPPHAGRLGTYGCHLLYVAYDLFTRRDVLYIVGSEIGVQSSSPPSLGFFPSDSSFGVALHRARLLGYFKHLQ